MPYHAQQEKQPLKKKVGIFFSVYGDPYGSRTHVYGVKGRRLDRLTNGPSTENSSSNFEQRSGTIVH